MINLVIKYGGSFNIPDNNNKTPLDYINNNEKINIIKKKLDIKGNMRNDILEISVDSYFSSKNKNKLLLKII